LVRLSGAQSPRDYAWAMLPVAHVGHYLWVLYVPPVLIVLGAIVKNVVSERRRDD
jgi:hypothetical protein